MTGDAAGAGSGVKLGYLSYGDVVPFVKEVSDGIAAAGGGRRRGARRVRRAAGPDEGRRLHEAAHRGRREGRHPVPGRCSPTRQPSARSSRAGMPRHRRSSSPTIPARRRSSGRTTCAAGQIAGTAVGEFVKAKWSCTYDAYVSLESTAAPDRSQKRMEGYRQGFQSVCPGAHHNEQRRAVGGPRRDGQDGDGGCPLGRSPARRRSSSWRSTTTRCWARSQAAAAAGRQADVWVSGQGGEPRVRDLIRTNEHYLGDAAYFPERYGATIVPALLDRSPARPSQTPLLIEPAWLDATTIGDDLPAVAGGEAPRPAEPRSPRRGRGEAAARTRRRQVGRRRRSRHRRSPRTCPRGGASRSIAARARTCSSGSSCEERRPACRPRLRPRPAPRRRASARGRTRARPARSRPPRRRRRRAASAGRSSRSSTSSWPAGTTSARARDLGREQVDARRTRRRRRRGRARRTRRPGRAAHRAAWHRRDAWHGGTLRRRRCRDARFAGAVRPGAVMPPRCARSRKCVAQLMHGS